MTGELRLHVHGMDCADEAALVRQALASHRGVARLEFDLVNGFVDIVFDDEQSSEAALVAAVQGTGLPAHPAYRAEGPRRVPAEHAGHLDEPHVAIWRSPTTVSMIASGVLFAVAWLIGSVSADRWLDALFQHTDDPRAIVVYGLSALAGLWPMWPRAVASVRHRRLDMHVLVCLSVVGAALVGEWAEGAAVAFLFALAHRVEAWSIERARHEIAALVGRGPSLVVRGLQHPAPVERWIERFAAIYTPTVTVAAILLAVVPPLLDANWRDWFYRALVFLVLACPCALVISTPVTMVAALTSAARRGILVKGGDVLERAAGAAELTRGGLEAAGVTIVGVGEDRWTAIEDADVVLADPDEQAVHLLVAHARRALGVVRQNVAVALATKLAFMVSASLGAAPLWMAVLADTGATVVVTFNGLRLLRLGETIRVSGPAGGNQSRARP
ncbi:MAG: P-type ATPase [Acidobacteriota bacterium]